MLQENKRLSMVGGMISVFLAAILASGCATGKPMALSEKMNLEKESVALLTIKASNQYKSSYQPEVYYIFVSTVDKKPQEDYRFKVEESYTKVENEFNEYLVSIALPSGIYKLRNITGISGKFPVVGSFSIPVFTNFELKPNIIAYLGRIEAVNRERKNDNEFRAGPVIPLIDQAVTGFSGGTFDINIVDRYEQEVSIFKQKYVGLTNYEIEKTILPPWKTPSEEDMK